MNLAVTDRDEQKTRLGSIIDAFHEVSIKEEETKLTFEQHMNKVLDGILDIKEFLQENADGISALLVKIEEVTWFEDVDDESLAELEGLINDLNDLNKAMLNNYTSLKPFCFEHGVGNKELAAYEEAANDVKEMADDLQAIFFTLPFDEDFQALNKELSGL